MVNTKMHIFVWSPQLHCCIVQHCCTSTSCVSLPSHQGLHDVGLGMERGNLRDHRLEPARKSTSTTTHPYQKRHPEAHTSLVITKFQAISTRASYLFKMPLLFRSNGISRTLPSVFTSETKHLTSTTSNSDVVWCFGSNFEENFYCRHGQLASRRNSWKRRPTKSHHRSLSNKVPCTYSRTNQDWMAPTVLWLILPTMVTPTRRLHTLRPQGKRRRQIH